MIQMSSEEFAKLDITLAIKENTKNNTYKLIDKRGRSQVWEFFAKIQNENGEEIAGLVACKMYLCVIKFTLSTSNLVRHRCFLSNCPENASVIQVNSDTKQNGIALITEWVVKNCRSFNIIEDSGLKLFAAFLVKVGATYGPNVDIDHLLHDPTTISRNISKTYEQHFEPIKAGILQYNKFGYSINCDIWTDSFLKASYVSCTIHYVKEEVLVDRLLAMKTMNNKSCTGSKLLIF